MRNTRLLGYRGNEEGAGTPSGERVADVIEPTSGVEHLRGMLQAVARGDRAAFEGLYRATSAKLFGVCLRILPKRSDAEEVLQEAYTTIWRKAGSYDAALASPITWLVMVARNKAIDRVRSGDGERMLEPIDAAGDIADGGAPMAASVEADDDRRRLDRCLGELDAARQRLVRTAFFDGATYEELAARCGAPLGTVKSWIRRSLLKLKACLEQ
jgi:RNA polymerase sigma-70 factor (ECF subfamily)